MKFNEYQKGCKYRTYQDNKCVNEDNPQRLLVNSCLFQNCPCVKETRNKDENEKNEQKS